MKPFRQSLQRVFVASQGLAVHKDIETGVFPLNHNVQTRSHRSEFSVDISRMGAKLPCGYTINYCIMAFKLLKFTLKFSESHKRVMANCPTGPILLVDSFCFLLPR
jgi:hypothetical protein